MTLGAGEKLGRYEVRSRIGVGGMGEVYLASDAQLDRMVALKVLPAEVAADHQRMQRFIQEAKSASALNHPNILTIYEIGEANGVNFIATEFVDGETLSDRMSRTRLKLSEVLELASQIASALAKAHQSGITHRDIKPDNVMVNRDGYVKLLDFGLAKFSEPPLPTDTEAPTRVFINTEPGVVMGTTRYMSPEQARGLEVDARTDIWSLGVVIYEMITGHPPFAGDTTSDLITSILAFEPQPLAHFVPEVPHELDRIVRKTLTKDRDERYQVIKDLLIDLRSCKRELELEAEVDRTLPPHMRAATASTIHSGVLTSQKSPALTTAVSVPPASSTAKLFTKIKQHKAIAFIALTAVALAVVGIAILYLKRTPALTEKDTILLADFVNTTGDQVFDGTLKQALAVQLGQSPYLNIFSDDRVRDALRFMGRSPDERVTKEIAREICERQGLKALLAGSISGLGSHYVITLEALNARSGDVIAREQGEAQSKEQVLKILGEASSRLREKLGESLSSIQKFDAPIEQATTSSLEALKAFTLGNETRDKGSEIDAIPLYKRAVELDPNFALAYARMSVMYGNTGQFGMAAEAAKKAFDLRGRASEFEKLYIAEKYYSFYTGEVDKQIEVLELWTRTYPRDGTPFNNLALLHRWTGQPEKAVAEARESARLMPNRVTPYMNWASAFVQMGRYEEAKKVLEEGLKQVPDAPTYHGLLYRIAFVEGDEAEMQKQAQWFSGKPAEAEMLNFQASAAASMGQLRKSQDFSRRAIEFWTSRGRKENAATRIAMDAMAAASFGKCGEMRANMPKALAITRSKLTLAVAAMAFTLCNDSSQGESFVAELAKRHPTESDINAILLPTIRALTEKNRGNTAQAIQLLQATSRYELGIQAVYWPIYIRGQAYLQQRSGTDALFEFQKIIHHRGIDIGSPLYPLAHIGLARAALVSGDPAKARKAYQDFFTLWKDADQDIPVLLEAKVEYEKLK